MVKKKTLMKVCPDCGSTNIIYNKKGDLICRDCGLIFAKLTPEEEKKYHKK